MKKLIIYLVISVTININSFSQINEYKLLPGDGAFGDLFGSSVSISGNCAIVGAPFSNDSAGAAYVFEWDGLSWNESQKLTASDGTNGDMFGSRLSGISMSGNYAVIGAPFSNDSVGAAYVFRLEGSYWIEEQKLIASDGKAGDSFGTTVSIYDDYLIIGSPYSDSLKGSAYIFRKEGSNWIEEQKLSRSDIYRWFGTAVSISGDYIIVGASYIIGAAYIYKREGNTWLEEQKLVPSGEDTLFNYFGISVSISGDYAVVGSPGSITNGIYPGAAYVFKRDGINWTEEQKLVTSDGANRDFFGLSVSISSGYIVVGAPWDGDAGAMSGSSYIFSKSGSNWIEKQKLTANDGNSADIFGVSVSIAENIAIIGASGNDDNGQNSGSAYIYNNFVVDVENDEIETPFYYDLNQNYPNPFNPSTTIIYSIPRVSNVVIKIYDVLCTEIETLVSEEKSIGTYEITWYAENLPSGIYFYRLQAGDFIETKKMMLIK